jgi:hypothetical protein
VDQFGAGNQFTKGAIETCIVEGLSGIADHDCAMNAIQIVFEFLGPNLDEREARKSNRL